MILFIVGPTAVGKSRLALLLAQRMGGEIISADSMQIYRGMDIGTGKPSVEERALIPHHLIDELEPSETWDAFRFSKRARKVMGDIESRGHRPIIVGGSGLYVRALVDGIFDGPGADWEVRRGLYDEAERQGPAVLYQRLGEVDPEAAAKIQSNDLRRIVRALEIFEGTGKSATEWKRQTSGLAVEMPVLLIGLTAPREALYARIDARVEAMFAHGFLQEVERLAPLPLSRTASRALGYKEILAHLRGEMDLTQAQRLTQQNTRHFARRQWAWFKPDPRIHWIDVESQDPLHAAEALLPKSENSLR